jgi:inorganic pyrophosphatase
VRAGGRALNLWQTTPRGRDPPRELYVVVETPRGSRNKYELAKEFPGVLLDRILHASLAFPADYGLVPRSWGEDGDPLDALVVGSGPTFPGCIVRARPIGMLDMVDRGEPDQKILCALVGDPRYASVHEAAQLGEPFLLEVEEFFRTYKRLEAGADAIDVRGWRSVEEAHATLEAAFARYDGKFR